MKENRDKYQKSLDSNMNKYRIVNVKVTTDEKGKLFFDIEWVGDTPEGYYELRLFDKERNCLEVLAYASHTERVIVPDFNLNLQSKKVNTETFYVELGFADYSDDGELIEWESIISSEPIVVKIYYKWHIFGKNEMKIV